MGQLAVEHELRLGHVALVVQVVDVRRRGHRGSRGQVFAVAAVAVVVLVEEMVVGIFRHGRGWVRDFGTLLVEQRHLGSDASHTRLVGLAKFRRRDGQDTEMAPNQTGRDLSLLYLSLRDISWSTSYAPHTKHTLKHTPHCLEFSAGSVLLPLARFFLQRVRNGKSLMH